MWFPFHIQIKLKAFKEVVKFWLLFSIMELYVRTWTGGG